VSRSDPSGNLCLTLKDGDSVRFSEYDGMVTIMRCQTHGESGAAFLSSSVWGRLFRSQDVCAVTLVGGTVLEVFCSRVELARAAFTFRAPRSCRIERVGP